MLHVNSFSLGSPAPPPSRLRHRARRMPKSTSNLFGAASTHCAALAATERLEVQGVDQARFDELRLRQRRSHAQDRLAREEHGAFGHGVNVAAETKLTEAVEKLLAEPAGARKPRNVRIRKAERFQKIERLSETGGQQNPRRGGKVRAKNSNTALSVSPWSR